MTTTSPLTNLRPVGSAALQAGHTRTVYRANTEPDIGPDAYPPSVGIVVDLRRADETTKLRHPLADLPGYHATPLFDPASPVQQAPEALELREQYLDWLVRHRASIRAVFGALADAPRDTDVLVCCSAGKDRTGIVSALLARLWGADDACIGSDYAATAAALAERFARERAVSTDLAWHDRNARAEAEVAVAVVHHVEDAYGSVRGYLRWIGLSDREVDRL